AFHRSGPSMRRTIRDSWRWSTSDLLSNAVRGRKLHAEGRNSHEKQRTVITLLRLLVAPSVPPPALALAQNPNAPVVKRAVLTRNLARTWNLETGDLRGWAASGQ